ncbi:MAG: sulfotransferase family protein [Xanthomonadaceae bacterium]|nr:sulfotransferase family protein [Xanthomonadaceae bacterium]
MLISYRYNFLFVHIAKTGGTSVRAALRPYRWGGWYSFPAWVGSMLDQATGHAVPAKFRRHAKAIVAQEMLPADLWRRLFKFTVVRNPYDLQVSAWLHLQREHPRLVDGFASFPEFIAYKFDPERAPEPLVDITMQPMSEYVVDLQGRVIIDYIAHTETLDDDFATICARIGLNPPPALPRARAAQGRKPYRAYYDDASRAAVARHYARDLEVFGYEW